MRHIPNLITLLNLLFGCLAIAFILEERILFASSMDHGLYPVMNMTKIYWGSLFIILAAFMDALDGAAARILNAQSPIGKDLDSLADVVSFGVAPSMVLYKYIQLAYMAEPGAMDTPVLVILPAFFVAACGALRLARYNQIATSNDNFFVGVPIPAIGLLIASIPLITWFPSNFMLNNFPNTYHLSMIFEHRWILYGISIASGLLMISKWKLLKWKPKSWNLRHAWPQLLLLVVVLLGGILFNFVVVPLAFIIYVISSLIYFRINPSV